MSNFAFLAATVPAALHSADRAESYLASDPIAACFYSRRAAEQLTEHLYDALGLGYAPNDQFARLKNRAFVREVPDKILDKLHAIRLIGNTAVHQQIVQVDSARRSVAELFHVAIWVALHHSPNPAARAGRGQTHHRQPRTRKAPGQALRRLPRSPDRTPPRHLPHQRLPARTVGRRRLPRRPMARRRRISASRGAGLRHP